MKRVTQIAMRFSRTDKSMEVLGFLFFLLFTIKPSYFQVIDEYMRREHSLVKPYQGLTASNAYWDFLGSTLVTHNHIRLTGEIQSQRGALWNRIPSYVHHWEVQIHFKVHGKDKKLFGDGFAFWYVQNPMELGSVFGSRDYFSGLAIIADTYNNHNGPHNHEHPYISAMINNGSQHYDHDRDGTHTQLDGCSAKFRNVAHDTYMSVKYQNNALTVSLDIKNKGKFDECFRVDAIDLPTGYYFGLSAATGDLFDAHDIISVKMFDLTTPDDDISIDRTRISPKASHFEAPRDHVDDPAPPMSIFKKISLIALGVLVICVSVVICGLIYSKQQEQKRKRFY